MTKASRSRWFRALYSATIAGLLSLAAATASHAQQDRDLQGYTLVFSDEFDGPLSLGSHRDKGSAKWADGPPYGPASSFSFSHWGVVEAKRTVWTTNNGILSLHMIYDPEINDPNDRKWVSGVISSRDRLNHGFAQRFGYWSARIKMPNAGKGAWSAFWLASTAGIPSGGGDGYEIDILEFYGGILTPGNPPTYNQPPWFDFLIHAWRDSGGQEDAYSGGRGKIPLSDPVSNWHVYGCEVNPTHIIGYLDGVEVSRTSIGSKYINDPLYIIINYALKDDHTGEPFQRHGPSAMEVDWVRAYELPEDPTPTRPDPPRNLRIP
jgi:beta-glucanase (GH16 family)